MFRLKKFVLYDSRITPSDIFCDSLLPSFDLTGYSTVAVALEQGWATAGTRAKIGTRARKSGTRAGNIFDSPVSSVELGFTHPVIYGILRTFMH